MSKFSPFWKVERVKVPEMDGLKILQEERLSYGRHDLECGKIVVPINILKSNNILVRVSNFSGNGEVEFYLDDIDWQSGHRLNEQGAKLLDLDVLREGEIIRISNNCTRPVLVLERRSEV